MTHTHLSQVVPQRQQSSLPLPLHLVEREEFAGCAEKGKSHTGVMQLPAARLAHNSKPFSQSVSSIWIFFAHAGSEGGLLQKKGVYYYSSGS